jgi:hypothetical protein
VTTTAGYRVLVKGGKVYLTEVEPSSDPGMSCYEATELGQRLIHAGATAARDRAAAARRRPGPRSRPAPGTLESYPLADLEPVDPAPWDGDP